MVLSIDENEVARLGKIESILVKSQSDSNLNRIQTLLQTLLDYEYGYSSYSAEDILNYGCWCQLAKSERTEFEIYLLRTII